jgi:hypothetical protein
LCQKSVNAPDSLYLRLCATQILDGHGGVPGLLLPSNAYRAFSIRAFNCARLPPRNAFDTQSGVAQALDAQIFGDHPEAGRLRLGSNIG